MTGNLFENFIIGEFIRYRYNNTKSNNLYFWRNNTGNEIDLLIEQTNRLFPVEIKSGMTVNSDYFKGLHFWKKISGEKEGWIIYAGERYQKRRKEISVLPWRKMADLFKTILS